MSVKESVQGADIVFKGHVISITITDDLSQYGIELKGDSNSFSLGWAKRPVAVVKIKVEKIYNSRKHFDTLIVVTPSNSAACGFTFKIGQDYIVYGSKRDQALPGNSLKRYAVNPKTFFTHLCTRTTQFFEAEENQIQRLKSSTAYNRY